MYMDRILGTFGSLLHWTTQTVMLRSHAGHLGDQKYDLLGIIGTMLMKDPVFPVPSALIEKACSFNDYPCGKVFDLGDGIIIKTGKLNHPNGACGLPHRIWRQSLCNLYGYRTLRRKTGRRGSALADQADAMIYDSAYTDDE